MKTVIIKTDQAEHDYRVINETAGYFPLAVGDTIFISEKQSPVRVYRTTFNLKKVELQIFVVNIQQDLYNLPPENTAWYKKLHPAKP